MNQSNNNLAPAMISAIAGMTFGTTVSNGQIAFLANIPEALRPIYSKAQIWYQWATAGFVPTWHIPTNGILQTNIGVSITDTISRILGGNISLHTTDKELKDNYIEESYSAVLNKAITYAVKGGTSLVKVNREDGIPYLEAFRIDNFVASADRKGRVSHADIYLDYLETGKDQSRRNGYWLVERREWKNGKGVCRYYVSKSTLSNGGASKGLYTTYENLPVEVKEWLDEHNVELDKDFECDFNGTLGVFLLKVRDLGIDANSVFGESYINPILSDLYEYEYNENCKVVDLYTGRSRIMTSAAYTNNTLGPVGGLDNYLLLEVPSNTLEANKPEALQFEYRIEEHLRAKEEILESMASKIGVSAISLGSYLKGDNTKTATEVSAETDATANFAASIRRDYIIPFVKRVLDSITNSEYTITFPTSGFTSLRVRMEQAVQLYENGLATVEQAIKIMYPDAAPEEIAEMAESIKAERKSEHIDLFEEDSNKIDNKQEN